MSDKIAIKRAMRRGSIRWQLVRWLNEPMEGDGAYIDTLEPLVQDMLKEQMQIVADWMIARGYATGHGDSMESLLGELGDEIDDCLNATGDANE